MTASSISNPINIDHIEAFLACSTPQAWVDEAVKPQNLQILLVDHANAELKAAQSGQALIWKYASPGKNVRDRASHIDTHELLNKMSRLAREELRHFEQVIALMKKRGIAYIHLSSARYAAGMRVGMRNHEPEKLIDSLIIGAFIEARSCERFAKLAPNLDEDIKDFYLSLLKSESRHFEDYLTLAAKYSPAPIDERVEYYRVLEGALIESPDSEFRFHSGPLE